MRPRVAVWLLLLAVACAPPPRVPAGGARAATGAALQEDPIGVETRAIREMAHATPHAFDVVRSLTDEVGPRSAGSPGDKVAVAWAARTMAAVGLKHVRTEPVTITYWARGEEAGKIVSPVEQKLSLTALGGSVGTTGLQADVVEFDSLDALAKADPARVSGKIVFLDTPMHRARDGADYGRVVGGRSMGAVTASRLGAVGLVIRSVGTDTNRLPHTGAMRPADIPAAALAIPDAELLHRLVAAGRPVRIALTLGARIVGDAESANVVGELVGRDLPGDIVLLGAHLDSWDLGTGAVDDGAGCAIVLEAARLIAARPRPPRRTVRVVLFANEEHGLSGASAYARAHEAEVAHHVAALEADLGAGRVYEVRILGGANAGLLRASIASHSASLGVTADAGDTGGGADLGPLRELGVPVVELSQDATTYFDFHHTANDTLDKIEPTALEEAAVAFASTAYELADTTVDLGRVPEDRRNPSKPRW